MDIEKAKKIIDTWCSCSLGVYLIHIIYLDLYKKYMAGTRPDPWLSIPILTIVILILSFLTVYIIRKFPIGKKIA